MAASLFVLGAGRNIACYDCCNGKRQELEHLRQQNDLLMFQKAYAALLLKWRGERVPTVTELEAIL